VLHHIVLIIAAIAFSGIAILISNSFKATKNKQKEPYECGIPRGENMDPMWVIIYLPCFLIFDVGWYFFILGRGGKNGGMAG
jgi:NADH:ubiquinone oxidoreductase subunit 3 (subunit A)